MSQPPNQPHRDQWYRSDDEQYDRPGYGQAGRGGGHSGYGQYPDDPRHGETQGQYGEGYGSYRQPADQSYPGYGQDQSYGGQGQGQSYGGHGQGQSYGGYGQPADQGGYSGYGQGQPAEQGYPGYGQGQSYGGYGQPADQGGYPGYGQTTTGSYGAAPSPTYPGYSGGDDPVPSYDEPDKPRRGRARKIALIAVVVAVVLCGGGGVAAYTFFNKDAKESAEAAKTRLVQPEKLGNRPRIKDGELQVLANKLVTEMKRDVPKATSTVGAFYGNPANKDLVMIAGASGKVDDPAKQLDQAIREMAAGGLKVTNATAVEPGPLGGVAKCGDATADDVPMGVCAWSDKGSLGMIVIYFKNSSQARAEFVSIRGAIQQRG